MKKTLYTIAFIALCSVMSNAQTSDNVKKQEPAKAKVEAVNDDGTAAPLPSSAVSDNAPAQSPAVKEEKKAADKPVGGTRMAITEKGVPAAKTPAEKKPEATKTEKH